MKQKTCNFEHAGIKKFLFVFLLLFLTAIVSNAYTLRESVQDELKPRNVRQEIIDETIEEMLLSREEIGMEENQKDIDRFIKSFGEILKKDKNNIVAEDMIAALYLQGSNKDFVKSKRILDKNQKYYERFEYLLNYGTYYYIKGEKSKADEYFDKIKIEFREKPIAYKIVEIIKINVDFEKKLNVKNDKLLETMESLYDNKNYEEEMKKSEVLLRDIYDYFQKNKKEQKEFGMIDETLYSYKLGLNLRKFYSIIENEKLKNRYGEAMKFYIQNIANDAELTEDIVRYNNSMEMIAFAVSMGVMVQGQSEGMSQKDTEKYINQIQNSKLFKIMEKLENNKYDEYNSEDFKK